MVDFIDILDPLAEPDQKKKKKPNTNTNPNPNPDRPSTRPRVRLRCFGPKRAYGAVASKKVYRDAPATCSSSQCGTTTTRIRGSVILHRFAGVGSLTFQRYPQTTIIVFVTVIGKKARYITARCGAELVCM